MFTLLELVTIIKEKNRCKSQCGGPPGGTILSSGGPHGGPPISPVCGGHVGLGIPLVAST